jgi:hypothetical protein
MTIKELIQELQKYPEDTRVLVHGYEDGFDDVSEVKEGVFNENVNTEWYYGKHQEADKKSPYTFDGIIIK